jgi:hypothetical protein
MDAAKEKNNPDINNRFDRSCFCIHFSSPLIIAHLIFLPE